jgi:NADP-dependent 3-hydroxy acid dehydrogenase YdfG
MVQTKVQKNCVVVGAGPGNGAAFARRFAAEDHSVALLARDQSRMDSLAATLPGARAYACDVLDQTAFEETLAAVGQDLGPVDVLIFNAGRGVWGDALSIRLEDFEASWRMNAYSALVAARMVLPSMIERASGTILFVGATASKRGAAGTAAFASAKAAQRSLAESLAKAYGPKGVHVALMIIDAVVAGPRTQAQFSDRPESFFAQPDDIAEAAWMLACQRPSAWTFELDLRPFGETW